ncbi:hypothetical protein [Streptomyces sp. NPDC026659]
MLVTVVLAGKDPHLDPRDYGNGFQLTWHTRTVPLWGGARAPRCR